MDYETLQEAAYADPLRSAAGVLPSRLTRRTGRLLVGLSVNF